MKKLLILAAAASLGATMANAQTTVTTTGTAGAVQIEPQYRTKIKTYITEQKVRPVTTREKIVVGAKLPSEVELQAVPSDWGPSLTKYRYVYSGDRVMLVDPGTRTVVQVVDLSAFEGEHSNSSSVGKANGSRECARYRDARAHHSEPSI
jgi:hypothetical protein